MNRAVEKSVTMTLPFSVSLWQNDRQHLHTFEQDAGRENHLKTTWKFRSSQQKLEDNLLQFNNKIQRYKFKNDKAQTQELNGSLATLKATWFSTKRSSQWLSTFRLFLPASMANNQDLWQPQWKQRPQLNLSLTGSDRSWKSDRQPWCPWQTDMACHTIQLERNKSSTSPRTFKMDLPDHSPLWTNSGTWDSDGQWQWKFITQNSKIIISWIGRQLTLLLLNGKSWQIQITQGWQPPSQNEWLLPTLEQTYCSPPVHLSLWPV